MIAKGEVPTHEQALREIIRYASGAARLTRRLAGILAIAECALDGKPLPAWFREPKKRDITWKRSPMAPESKGWYLCLVIEQATRATRHEVKYYDGEGWVGPSKVHSWLTVKIPGPR